MKKAEREEKEKLEAKEKEQKRIASGKDMGAIRQQIEEQEIKKMAEQRRREKQVSLDTEQEKFIIYCPSLQEEKAAKAKVLAQIEADKAARRAEREAAKNPAAAAAPPTQQPAAAAPAVKKWVAIISASTE